MTQAGNPATGEVATGFATMLDALGFDTDQEMTGRQALAAQKMLVNVMPQLSGPALRFGLAQRIEQMPAGPERTQLTTVFKDMFEPAGEKPATPLQVGNAYQKAAESGLIDPLSTDLEDFAISFGLRPAPQGYTAQADVMRFLIENMAPAEQQQLEAASPDERLQIAETLAQRAQALRVEFGKIGTIQRM